MNNSPLANSLSVSVRIYRALLLAYPKRFREHYETQLVQVFRDSFRYEYHRNGVYGVIDLWLHTFADLLVTALMERIMERSQYMFSPKVILWGGVASVCAGLFYIMSGLAPNGGSFVFALVLGLGGLVSLYSQQAGQGGRLASAGFALGIIGTVLVLAVLWWSSTIFSGPTYAIIHLRIEREPVLAGRAVLMGSLGLVTLGIGLALLGIASLRAKTLHRRRGLPIGLGLLNTIQGITVVLLAYEPLSQGRIFFDPWPPEGYALIAAEFVLLGLGWIGLGTMLATEAEAQVAPPEASAETR
jgi:hypothetical protein